MKLGARGNGKVFVSLQKIKETVESGKKVLYVRKAGQVLIDKNGCTPIQSKNDKEHRINVIRDICGSFAIGRCNGNCIDCLDRFIEKQECK